MRNVTIAAVVLAGVGQIVLTLSEPDFNTAAGLGIGAGFFLLAGLSATGRWWALGLVALISGLLTIAAVGQLVERIELGETGEILRVLGFQTLTTTATIAGSVSMVRGYRTRHSVRKRA